jgi:uncharacterized SAM-binding protein YcdF (DUF218 family)
MSTPIIATVVGLMAIALLLIVLRRVVRLAIRLALVGVVALVLLVGGGVWWWNNSGSGNANAPADNRQGTTGTTRRGNSR